MPAASGVPLAFESVPFDESRWNAWVNKGRLADTAYKENADMAMLRDRCGWRGRRQVFLG